MTIKNKINLMWSLLFLSILLIVILVPLSYNYIEYNEIALKQYRFGAVSNDVYMNGRYYTPLTYKFVRFPSTFVNVELSSSVFTSSGFQIIINYTFYYKLLPSKLYDLYNTYSNNYDNRIQSIAKTAVRNALPIFSVNDYFTNRSYIENYVALNVSQQVENIGVYCSPDYFKIISVTLPATLITSSLETAVTLQNNQQQLYYKTLQETYAMTDTMVSYINNNASMILLTAQNNATQIVQNSIAESNKILEYANSNGLNYTFTLLGINTLSDKLNFIKLVNLQNNNNVTLLSGNFVPIINT